MGEEEGGKRGASSVASKQEREAVLAVSVSVTLYCAVGYVAHRPRLSAAQEMFFERCFDQEEKLAALFLPLEC